MELKDYTCKICGKNVNCSQWPLRDDGAPRREDLSCLINDMCHKCVYDMFEN